MYNNDYRKMRRKRIYIKLLIFWISLIVLIGGGYLFYRAHMVKNVTVTGNVHYTSEEIQDMVMTDELSHNSFTCPWYTKTRPSRMCRSLRPCPWRLWRPTVSK